MSPRPPSDAVVALRSLPRRFRGLFAGLEDDESPDDLAHRPGPDGTSAAAHIAATTAVLAHGHDAVSDALGPGGSAAPISAPGPGPTSGPVDDLLAFLGHEADRLAARIEHVGAEEWSRPGALDRLWEAVDQSVGNLKAAEQTLRQVRS